MAEKTFDKRLFEALSEMENPVKDANADIKTSSGAKFSYSYATLDNVMGIVKPILAKHGLFVRQSCEKDGDGWTLRTYVFDPTESRLMDERPLIFDSNSQNNGIRETYARRYALNCCMGLAPIDSDAVETRNVVQTTPALRSRVEKGVEAVRQLGIDPTGILNDFAGWENDMTIAKNLVGVLGETYKTANKVQGQFPGTEIKEA